MAVQFSRSRPIASWLAVQEHAHEVPFVGQIKMRSVLYRVLAFSLMLYRNGGHSYHRAPHHPRASATPTQMMAKKEHTQYNHGQDQRQTNCSS